MDKILRRVSCVKKHELLRLSMIEPERTPNKQISKVKKLPERYFKVMQALRSLGSIVSLD